MDIRWDIEVWMTADRSICQGWVKEAVIEYKSRLYIVGARGDYVGSGLVYTGDGRNGK